MDQEFIQEEIEYQIIEVPKTKKIKGTQIFRGHVDTQDFEHEHQNTNIQHQLKLYEVLKLNINLPDWTEFLQVTIKIS